VTVPYILVVRLCRILKSSTNGRTPGDLPALSGFAFEANYLTGALGAGLATAVVMEGHLSLEQIFGFGLIGIVATGFAGTASAFALQYTDDLSAGRALRAIGCS